MSSGNIQLKIESSGITDEDLHEVFEVALQKQTEALRKKGATFLREVRKKRHKILKSAHDLGYLAGYKKGAKEGTKAFHSTSRHVRAFRKHLEQVAISVVIEILQNILPLERTVQTQIIRKILRELKPRLRDLTFTHCVRNPKSKITSSVVNEIASYKILCELDESIPLDHLKLVTTSGELTICSSQATSKEILRLIGNNHHELRD